MSPESMGSKSGLGLNRPTIKERVITQSIAIVFFVILPTVITLMVPLTNIEFKNAEAGATAKVVRYVLMFIPRKTERIENVKSLRADITAEKRYQGTSDEIRKDQKGVRVSTGQVAIVSDGPEVVVQAAPELATKIVKEFDMFVSTGSAKPLVFQVYASWALSYILGGVATAFCGLYVIGAALAILTFPFK